MKYLLEVQTYSMPGVKEYVVDVFSKEQAKEMFGNRIVLSSKENVYIVIPRRRDLIRTGITFNGTVVQREDIIEYSKKLTEKIGLEYAHGFQFKEDTKDSPKIIWINEYKVIK